MTINWKTIHNKTDLDNYNSVIYTEKVGELVEYSDDSVTLYKTIAINEFSPDNKTTYWLPEDFSLDYYDIDTTYFACMCGYFEQKLKQRKYFKNFKHRNCNEKIDFLDFKNRLVSNEHQITLLSDFSQYFKIRLEYEGFYKEISLEDPSKARWLLYDSKTKKKIIIINPYIHDIVNHLAPHWRKYGNFQAYKNLEHIYDVFLQKE